MQIAEVWLFLPSVLLFSAVASFTDAKFHKIKNSLILRMILVSLVLNAVYWVWGQVNILTYLGFVIFSALASFALWWFDFWKAGDVKFYTALSTFIHPATLQAFTIPLVAFVTASLIITLVESFLTKSISFSFKPTWSLLLPVAIAPVAPMIGINPLVVVIIFAYFAKSLKVSRNASIFLTLVAFIINPSIALKTAIASFLFFIASSFKFRGYLPSAPLISISFIYLLLS